MRNLKKCNNESNSPNLVANLLPSLTVVSILFKITNTSPNPPQQTSLPFISPSFLFSWTNYNDHLKIIPSCIQPWRTTTYVQHSTTHTHASKQKPTENSSLESMDQVWLKRNVVLYVPKVGSIEEVTFTATARINGMEWMEWMDGVGVGVAEISNHFHLRTGM